MVMTTKKKLAIAGAIAAVSTAITVPLLVVMLSATVWYVRLDGGTTAQCDGKTNTAYDGSGTGENCAFRDPQDAVNAATWGETIKLHAGDRFKRPWPLYLPTKGAPPTGTDADYITLTTDDETGTPALLGTTSRITTAMAAGMPKLVSTGSYPAINVPINSKYWKVERLEVTNEDNGVQCIRLVSFDMDEQMTAYNQLPDRLIFQYNWFHPVEETGTPLSPTNISRTAENAFYLAGNNVTIQHNSMQGFVGRFKYGGEAGNPMTSSNLLVTLGEHWRIENNLLEAWTYSFFASGGWPSEGAAVSNCVGNPTTACNFSNTTGLTVGDPVGVFVSTSSSGNKWGAAFVASIVGNTVTFMKPLCQSFDGGNSCTAQNGTPANGDKAQWDGYQPTDIYLSRNIFAHYPEWSAQLGVCGGKGYGEIKACVDCVFEGNTFTGCTGFTVTVRNQSGNTPWVSISGLAFKNNYFENGNNTFLAFGQDAIPTKRSTGLTWTNNLMVGVQTAPPYPSGRVSGNMQGVDNVTITHNTVAWAGGSYNFSLFEATGPMNNMTIQDNIFPMGQNACWLPDQSSTQQPVSKCFGAFTVDHNVLVPQDNGDAVYYGGEWWTNWAPNNWVQAKWADVGFTSMTEALTKTGNYRLLATSPYYKKASDGKDVGVDMDQLLAHLSGPIPIPTPTPSPTGPDNPTPTPTVTPSVTPTPQPTATPTPTPQPTPTPTPSNICQPNQLQSTGCYCRTQWIGNPKRCKP